ncbi:MAG: SusC/RagA family TonB-linked outer membrane protein, partial [Parapedobacter sp.]
MSNGSVTALIKDIQRQTGYAFLYNLNDIKELDAISISIESDNIREVLAESLKDLPLDFLVKEDEKVVILKRSTKKINRERLLASLRQQSTVQGIVVDTSGTPLTGVTVSVKNRASMATSTDVNGRYVLQVPEDAVLVFTMVGYHTHEVIVGNQREIDVVLEMSASLLDDVVVVGFGTQKRTNLVASVTSVSPGNLKVPSSNLTTALAGQAAGIIAYQRSGEPGQDNADFFVRGITTFGTNTNPLILIDGIELTSNDLARLRPDDIQSFSILKDATATALYGSRGANGVILVVTKQGKEGPAKFSFRVENSISAPTQTVDVADPVTYMRMHNEAILTRDPLGTILYSQEKIEMTEAGRYPLIYPANDWKSMLFKNYTMNQRSNLNVSGGGGVARYYVAGSFNRDNGILNVDKRNNFNNNIAINNYDLRSTVNIDL